MNKTILLLLSVVFLSGFKIVTQEQLAQMKEAEKQLLGHINIEQSWKKDIPAFSKENAITYEKALSYKNFDDAAFENVAFRNSSKAQWHIFINDKAEILEVSTKVEDGSISRNAFLMLDFSPFDGKADAKLQVGPSIQGSSLRDSMPFMDFKSFANQIDYSKSSRALHNLVFSDVTKEKIDLFAKGQKIQLLSVGIANFEDILLLTPIQIEIE